MKDSYDFVVVGGGSAGYAAARTAASLGLSTAVIEGGREVGGLCILRGCMPSKTLIESANRLEAIGHAAEFGIRVPPGSADLSAIIDRKNRLIGEFADYRRGQLEGGKFDFLRGWARFAEDRELEFAPQGGGPSHRIHARSVLVATGSTHTVPPIPGLAQAGFLTSDDVLDARSLPASVIVLGAGPVALEMAHYLAAVGVRVTIIQRSPQFLKGVDPDVAAVVEDAFRARGMVVHTGTSLLGVECRDGLKHVRFQTKDGEMCVAAEEIFNGLGRVPATKSLGLENAGVELDGHRIVTRQNQQTTNPAVFAAGDVCGPFEVVHIAISQGEIAARNSARFLAGKDPHEKSDYRLQLYAVFTEPQVAVVGLTESAAGGRPVRVASYPFGDHGKSLVMAEERGMVKLVADASTGEILGGAAVGPHASELIHEIVVAMAFRATARQLAAVPHYHPTLSEIWTYPAEELAGIG